MGQEQPGRYRKVYTHPWNVLCMYANFTVFKRWKNEKHEKGPHTAAVLHMISTLKWCFKLAELHSWLCWWIPLQGAIVRGLFMFLMLSSSSSLPILPNKRVCVTILHHFEKETDPSLFLLDCLSSTAQIYAGHILDIFSLTISILCIDILHVGGDVPSGTWQSMSRGECSLCPDLHFYWLPHLLSARCHLSGTIAVQEYIYSSINWMWVLFFWLWILVEYSITF